MEYNISRADDEELCLTFEKAYIEICSFSQNLLELDPLIVSHLFNELSKIFSDINHYSRVERLTIAAKKFYNHKKNEQEYALAYIRLLLNETEDFIQLSKTIEQYFSEVESVIKEAQLDVEEPRLKRAIFQFKISAYIGNTCSKAE